MFIKETKKLFYLLITVVLFGNCTKEETLEEKERSLYGGQPLSPFEQLIQEGRSLQLEEVYVCESENTVPMLISPIDALFEGKEDSILDLAAYQASYDSYNIQNAVLAALQKGEVWELGMYTREKTTIIEHGYGSSYSYAVATETYEYLTIKAKNDYVDRNLMSPIHAFGSGIYNYRGRDNYTFRIYSYNYSYNGYQLTNLIFTVLTDLRGSATELKPGYIFLETNGVNRINRYISPPLTGSAAKRIIEGGKEGVDYELWTYYFNYGSDLTMVVYNINGNLYTPTFGDTYKYVGSTNQTGMLSYYEGYFYRLKFKIL